MKISEFRIQNSELKKSKDSPSTIFRQRKMKNSAGFTLLELLVTISIISVLISLASVSYSSAQKKSRDAKRQGDLKAVQNAFEQFYSTCGTYAYPTALPAIGASLSCGSNTYLDKMPADPKTGNAYNCIGCTATSYTICANGAEIIPTPCVKNLQ